MVQRGISEREVVVCWQHGAPASGAHGQTAGAGVCVCDDSVKIRVDLMIGMSCNQSQNTQTHTFTSLSGVWSMPRCSGGCRARTGLSFALPE